MRLLRFERRLTGVLWSEARHQVLHCNALGMDSLLNHIAPFAGLGGGGGDGGPRKSYVRSQRARPRATACRAPRRRARRFAPSCSCTPATSRLFSLHSSTCSTSLPSLP